MKFQLLLLLPACSTVVIVTNFPNQPRSYDAVLGGIEGAKYSHSSNPELTATMLEGSWRVEKIIPVGEPFAGKYTTIWKFVENSGEITGSGIWSNGAQSQYSGKIEGRNICIERVDSDGFRGVFEGIVSSNAKMIGGIGKNDPSSVQGNSASYSWTAIRLEENTPKKDYNSLQSLRKKVPPHYTRLE